MGTPREWLTDPALAPEVLEVLRRVRQKAQSEPQLMARLVELEERGEASTRTAEADEGAQAIGLPDAQDVSNLSADKLADLILSTADLMTSEGRTADGLEVLLQRGAARRLFDAVDRALSRYERWPSEDVARRVLFDARSARAARYVLALAKHEHKAEKAPTIASDELLALWDKLEPVAMAHERGGIDDASREELSKALNHPAGDLAQALFEILLPNSVQYRSTLDARLKERVERNTVKPGGAGRAFLTIVASRLYLLHFAEPEWTASRLIPFFDWRDEARARASWQGYLWAPQLNQHLYAALRESFLATFAHAEQLGNLNESLCGLLVSLALDGGDTLKEPDTRKAIRDMSDDMRSTVLWQLGKRLEAAGGDSDEGADDSESTEPNESEVARVAELARTRILPWLRAWPQDAEVWTSHKFADRLTLVALRCGDAFPEATAFVVEQQRVKLGRYQLSLSRVLRWPNDRVLAFAPHVAQLFDHVLPGKKEHWRQDASVWRPGALQELVDKLREAGEPVTSSPEFKRLEARL